MPLTAGERIGPYEIIALLGVGGMGEVYRARDTQLDRQVALKILSPALAGDAQYMARFQREAKVLASLNHPNIAAIYGLEENALVMELVEGETLSGPLPVETAIAYGRQMCDGLEYAHEKGVVHRDLKPANVKVTPEGVIKLLDFGLAKVAEETVTTGNPDTSPTLTMAATRLGTIMGTAGYMAPEQARGQAVDKRADIWSFGVVLYEIVMGKRLFQGETVGDTLAQVLTKQIDVNRTPHQVRAVLRRCLERDRKKRLRHIGDVWMIEEQAPPVIIQSQSKMALLPWILMGLCAVAACVLAFLYLRQPGPAVVTLALNPPEKATFNQIAISPDGKLLAFTASTEGKRQLYVRPLHTLAAQALAGSDDAEQPFWSPDSRWIGFFALGKLKKIEAAGGPAQTLCDVATPRGGTWSQDGVILYSDIVPGVLRISAQGGTPAVAAAVDRPHGEANSRWPVFLPDGRSFLHSIRGNDAKLTGIYLSHLDGKPRKRLVGDLSNPGYAQDRHGAGYLLFVRAGTLMAQPMDAEKGALSGEAFPLAEKVGMDDSIARAHFSTSGTGTLVHDAAGDSGYRQMVWLDRSGKHLGTVGEAGIIYTPMLSPDEKTVAFRKIGEQQSDLWLLELARGVVTRFTFDPRADTNPVWSPDSVAIVYSNPQDGAMNLYRKNANGTGKEELLVKSPYTKYASDWSARAGILLYMEIDPKTKADLWVVPLQGDRKPVSLVRSDFSESNGSFAPDGKYFAYTCDESGRNEVYVQPYPVTGAKWQVSKSGGMIPRWRRDGKEIYFLTAEGAMMAAEISPSANFRIGNPTLLFQTGLSSIFERYSITGDGKRFLLALPLAENAGGVSATVVQNVFEGARR